MATSLRTTTPPPSSIIHTPSTPKFGKDDKYQPYSPRRKSARVSQRSQPAVTPPRRSRLSPNSPRSTRRVAYTGLDSSPPSSPQTAPKKPSPRLSPNMGGRRVSGALNFESTASAATALGIPTPRKESKKMETQRSTTRNNGMLPTPAKTPKKLEPENSFAITSVARNIFPARSETANEVMPSPKKKGRKRYMGFTLDSFESEEEPIAIYTDSQERIPEVDNSTDNPFYGESRLVVPDPVKRSSKRRKISVPGEEEDITLEEAERRQDGMVYVFRGKKQFRKFANDNTSTDPEDLEQNGMDAEITSKQLHRPLTRSSIKPRLLFPTPQQDKAKELRSQATEDDEEAVTDIEGPLTPTDQVDETAATPQAPKFAPFSPPTTVRATRSKDINMSSPGIDQVSEQEFTYLGRGGNSPFDGWKQTKNVSGTKKRGGEPLVKGRGGKKTRG